MWSWLDFIAKPMGMFLNFIYNMLSFHNYGIAIIIFTVFVRLIILPLTIKQYRSTAEMQKVQPLIQEVQKRYKNDKEKLNQEMMKIYSEHKVNPAGGCLPTLIQMPIILSLYWVISRPLYYMLGKTNEVISELYSLIPGDVSKIANNQDLTILNYFSAHKDQLPQVANLLKPDEVLNLNFLGLNLGLQPSFDPAMASVIGYQFFGLLLIPILATVSTYLSLKFSMAMQNSNQQGEQNQMAQTMTGSMTKIMPLMTGFFAFSVPAGLGLYWIVGNVIQVLQQMYLNKYVLKINQKDTAVVKSNPDEVSSKDIKVIETKKGKKSVNKK